MEKKKKIIDDIIKIFLSCFNEVYENTNKKDRKCLLEYINNFFRKWYYSSFIDNSELSPAFLVQGANDDKYSYYPVIGSSDRDISIRTYEYSPEEHPFLRDLRTISQSIGEIVKFDEELNISDEFFNDVKRNISIGDKRYVEYIFQIGMDMGIFEKMPSVGITAVRLGADSDIILKQNNRELFTLIVESAVDIAAYNLSEEFMGGYYEINPEDVEDWLKKPVPIDVIFNEFYDEMGIGADAMASLLTGDADEIDRAISVNSFRRGLNFDKWFLTPFGYYLRLIEPCYLCSFSFYDEIAFFIEAYKNSEGFRIKEIMDAAVYSPCTSYRITRLGAEIFGVEYERNAYDEFMDISPEEIVRIITEGSIKDVEKLLSVTNPEYDIITLRLSDFSKEKLWLDIDISADSTLDYLHLYISYIFRREVLLCKSFRFYKLPESPFTEYMPSYMEERGPKTDDTTIEELLNEGEECYYEAIFYSENGYIIAKARITHRKVSPCKKGYDYPRISKLCKKLKEEQNK